MNSACRETILLIEDDFVIRELYKKIFEFNGYNVIEAVDGGDGIAKFIEHQNEIHLLVSDVVMPNKSGKDAYFEIKNLKNDIKVIFTSAHDNEATKALKAAGLCFMQKPFSPQDLLLTIKEVLENNNNLKGKSS
jgi:two-component system, cell cycle sensor histidine kinase and response regulator CckA